MSGPVATILEAATGRRILVVGDLILDRYLFGHVSRISPEAPIQVFEVRGEDVKWGGAGNVARNLVELGSAVELFGVVGDDDEGRALQEGLRTNGCVADGVLLDPSRPTTVKTRHVAQNQQVLRVDRERRTPIDAALEGRLVTAIRTAVASAHLVVLSDYAKGLLTPAVVGGTLAAARERDVPVLVDPKGRDFGRYRGVTVLTPNRSEAEAETGVSLDDESRLREAGRLLVERADAQVAVITLGADGVFAYERDGRVHRVAAEARSVYDVTGAGDTLVAVLGVALATGAAIGDAVRLANLAAGIVVGKLGAVAVSPEELRAAAQGQEPPSGQKILEAAAVLPLLEAARSSGRVVVFTNGCFDLLHSGHLRYLEYAKAQGDLLVVGLNADASVTHLKGPGRPIQPLEERAALLAGLSCVDYVVAFEEETPEALIRQLRPDVLVKGEDWKDKGVVGKEFVEARGGRVVLAPLVKGRSTTVLVDSIRKRPNKSES